MKPAERYVTRGGRLVPSGGELPFPAPVEAGRKPSLCLASCVSRLDKTAEPLNAICGLSHYASFSFARSRGRLTGGESHLLSSKGRDLAAGAAALPIRLFKFDVNCYFWVLYTKFYRTENLGGLSFSMKTGRPRAVYSFFFQIRLA